MNAAKMGGAHFCIPCVPLYTEGIMNREYAAVPPAVPGRTNA